MDPTVPSMGARKVAPTSACWAVARACSSLSTLTSAAAADPAAEPPIPPLVPAPDPAAEDRDVDDDVAPEVTAADACACSAVAARWSSSANWLITVAAPPSAVIAASSALTQASTSAGDGVLGGVLVGLGSVVVLLVGAVVSVLVEPVVELVVETGVGEVADPAAVDTGAGVARVVADAVVVDAVVGVDDGGVVPSRGAHAVFTAARSAGRPLAAEVTGAGSGPEPLVDPVPPVRVPVGVDVGVDVPVG